MKYSSLLLDVLAATIFAVIVGAACLQDDPKVYLLLLSMGGLFLVTYIKTMGKIDKRNEDKNQ